jgi:hypothetical protein
LGWREEKGFLWEGDEVRAVGKIFSLMSDSGVFPDFFGS